MQWSKSYCLIVKFLKVIPVTVNYIKDKEKTIQRRFKGMCKGPEVGGRKRKTSWEGVHDVRNR